MTESFKILAAGVAGMALGAFFFGGLWWTVRRGLTARQPALWFLVSMLLRTGLTAAGFYIVCRGNWERALACLAGFIIARLVVTRLTHPRPETASATPGSGAASRAGSSPAFVAQATGAGSGSAPCGEADPRPGAKEAPYAP